MTVKKKKKRRQRRRRIAGLCIVLVAVAAAGVLFGKSRYIRTGGETLSVETKNMDLRNSSLTSLQGLERCTGLETLDLRGNELSAESVVELQNKLPDCAIRWDIPLGELRYDSELEELVLDDLSMADWQNLLLFPKLRKLTVNGFDDPEALSVLGEKGLELHYNVALGSRRINSLTPTLTVDDADVDELTAVLPLLPELRTLRVENCSLSDSEKLNLQQSYPDTVFVWDVSLGGQHCQSSASKLTIPAGQLSAAELREKLCLFPRMKDVDITACGYTLEEINGLRTAFPALHFIWSVEILGKTFSGDATEIDLSGIKMTDSTAVEAALPWLPDLERVVMCDCGFSNEEMDALNKKYADIRFVWRVYFGTFNLRTDATSFIAAKYDNWVMLHDGDCKVLNYCTDLEALDLGHMAISDLSFVRSMPHLKYLVVVEAYITDITPLADCKELKYLEIFKNPLADLAPLLEVKTMEDLNICYIWIPTDLAFQQLSQMTWLDRLWFCGTWFTEAQKQELQAKIPDCEMDMRWGAESTGGTWRKHEHYYEMRDAFDMYYMPGGTNGLNEEGQWVVNPG